MTWNVIETVVVDDTMDMHTTRTKIAPSITRDHCFNCGSTLGIDCGDAEPDYNEDFCSVGCYKIGIAKAEHAHGRIGALNARISAIAVDRDELRDKLNAVMKINTEAIQQRDQAQADLDHTDDVTYGLLILAERSTNAKNAEIKQLHEQKADLQAALQRERIER